MDGDTRRWVVGQVEDTALTGCKLLRSMLSDMGDVVCCLSGLGIATPISVVRPVGSVGLSRPPSLCEMLPVAHRRRNRPFEEKRVTDWSFEGLLDTPLRLFRSPGPPAPGRPEAASPEAPEEEGLQILSSNDLDALEGPVEIVEEHTFQEVYYLRDSRLVEGTGDPDSESGMELPAATTGLPPYHNLKVGPHRLEEAEVKGAIFDVDGTLLDTMPIFYPSWPRTGEQPRFGLRVSEEDFYRLAGVPLPDMVQRLHRAQKGCEATPAFVKDFIDEKIRLHQEEEAEKGHPPAISCVVALAEDYLRRGIPVAIATSGIKGIVLQHLEAAGLKDLVPAECMVFASDVPKGKPDPAIYLEAARRLGVDPTKCRAYEDGESGLQSAVAAGMETVDVTFMEGYPAPEALRQAKEEQIRERTWLL
ncbi:Phosphorylated carbohydrates phosphatase TM_1254 [Durusdinium trenchii]|uniref:Phosphorylated carbohydrates phosphatase TM_1254 n=1 Tax=Durusdinium trenchii TaxID=1381693 RepID=A0ABP0HCS9_9DINO